jgi:hypothetical protein
VLPDGFISDQKIPIFENFGRYCNGRCCYILCPFGQFSGYSASFMATWYIFPRFGTFFPVLVCCTEKNLATLMQSLFQKLQPLPDMLHFFHCTNTIGTTKNKSKFGPG